MPDLQIPSIRGARIPRRAGSHGSPSMMRGSQIRSIQAARIPRHVASLDTAPSIQGMPGCQSRSIRDAPIPRHVASLGLLNQVPLISVDRVISIQQRPRVNLHPYPLRASCAAL